VGTVIPARVVNCSTTVIATVTTSIEVTAVNIVVKYQSSDLALLQKLDPAWGVLQSTTPTHTPTPTPPPAPSPNGLSRSTKIGIGISIPIFFVIVGIVGFVFLRRLKKKAQIPQTDTEWRKAELPAVTERKRVELDGTAIVQLDAEASVPRELSA
jgi:H+/gluconate symporter-like permease